MTIKDWPAAERPREKLLEQGAGALAEQSQRCALATYPCVKCKEVLELVFMEILACC